MFSTVVTEFWQTEFTGDSILYADAQLQISSNAALDEGAHSTILTLSSGKTMVTLHPALATRLDIAGRSAWSADHLRQRLRAAGCTLHGADSLFYFPEAEAAALLREAVPADIRQLTPADRELFAEFCAQAPEQDLDAAYVELDHWLVFGVFAQGKLVSAGSMYAWMDSSIADFGMLTLPAYRKQGHGRRLVRAISQCACRLGFEPQYRSQLDNAPSLAAARAAGLRPYGAWDLILAPPPAAN